MTPDPGSVVEALGREDVWSSVRAVVLGFDDHAASAADNLLFLGAHVTALDETPADGMGAERARVLSDLGATIRLEAGATDALPEACDVLVIGPGRGRDERVVQQALERSIPVWSCVELAWRLRTPGPDGHLSAWLVVAGEQGRERTAAMTASIMRAAGSTCDAVGVGLRPVVEAVMEPDGCEVLAVTLSAEEMAFTTSLRPVSTVVRTLVPEAARAADASSTTGASAAWEGVYNGVAAACIYNLAEPATRTLVEDADVEEGARGIGITLGMPPVGTLGVVEDILVDRAFIAERSTSAAELCTISDLPLATPDVIADALAAAALARSFGASQAAVRDGLRHAG